MRCLYRRQIGKQSFSVQNTSCAKCCEQFEKKEPETICSGRSKPLLKIKACLLSDQKKTAKGILRKIPEQMKHIVSSSFPSDLLRLEIVTCLRQIFKLLPAIVNSQYKILLSP